MSTTLPWPRGVCLRSNACTARRPEAGGGSTDKPSAWRAASWLALCSKSCPAKLIVTAKRQPCYNSGASDRVPVATKFARRSTLYAGRRVRRREFP